MTGMGEEIAYVPAIEELEAARQRGKADFLAGGRMDRPPKFSHPAILNAWDRGFVEAQAAARRAETL